MFIIILYALFEIPKGPSQSLHEYLWLHNDIAAMTAAWKTNIPLALPRFWPLFSLPSSKYISTGKNVEFKMRGTKLLGGYLIFYAESTMAVASGITCRNLQRKNTQNNTLIHELKYEAYFN